MPERCPMLVGLALGLVILTGCYHRVEVTGYVVQRADDRRPIPEPVEETEGQWAIWDGTDKMLFYRVGQFLNLGVTFRTVGTWFGLADPIEAGNVNALDEVPDSTWFTNRHFFSRLSQEELARGSATGQGPDPAGTWAVVGGKESLGSTPGFRIRDQLGDVYLLKFDPPLHPEMTTASEVITPRFLYAAGYNVPEHYLVTLHPERLTVDPSAKIRGKYRVLRPMTEDDVRAILERVSHRPDGTIRAVASKFLPGVPKGPFLYEGKRPDDPNDRIRHENRRELRGLRVLAAFLNHTDTKAANALDMYDPETRYLTHYLIDFSSTLGADNAFPQLPRYGNEYFLDFGTVGLSTIALGAYVKPWEVPLRMEYPSIGYLEAVRFDPERWRPTFPNPAFLRTTVRDAYWGAKIVTSFTDDDIETIVRTGQFTDPRAERYIAEVLKVRRDKIGRYYFNLVNPLDRFALRDTASGEQALVFENLALVRGYAPSENATYRYNVRRLVSPGFDPELVPESVLSGPEVPLGNDLIQMLTQRTASARAMNGQPSIASVMIQTSYDGGEHWTKRVSVYLRLHAESGRFSIVGIERET